MAISAEQLKADMDKVMRANPMLHLATVSPETRQPHSATVWFAPDEELERLFWLSSPLRTHSAHIEEHQVAGQPAPVSGSMNLLVRPSMPVLGMSFEGAASRLVKPADVEAALGTLLTHAVFTEQEIAQYLDPTEESAVPTHAVYAAEIQQWTDFDGLREPADRKAVTAWPRPAG